MFTKVGLKGRIICPPTETGNEKKRVFSYRRKSRRNDYAWHVESISKYS